MSKLTHTLALTAGIAIGYALMGVIYAETVWRTCYNVDTDGGFKCSNCKSGTDYQPKAPFRFCPICGAFVIGWERL